MTLGIKESKLIEFMEIVDERGSLVPLEGLKNIPFEIKRVYYIYNTKPDAPRGFHAMKNTELVMICLYGSCDVILDDGKQKKNYHLNNKNQGLFIDKMIWHEMHNLTEDCVLIVLTNDYYNEIDNLRDYQSFLKEL